MPKIDRYHVIAFVGGVIVWTVVGWLTEKFLERNGPRFGVGDDAGLV